MFEVAHQSPHLFDEERPPFHAMEGDPKEPEEKRFRLLAKPGFCGWQSVGRTRRCGSQEQGEVVPGRALAGARRRGLIARSLGCSCRAAAAGSAMERHPRTPRSPPRSSCSPGSRLPESRGWGPGSHSVGKPEVSSLACPPLHRWTSARPASLTLRGSLPFSWWELSLSQLPQPARPPRAVAVFYGLKSGNGEERCHGDCSERRQ